MKIAKNTKPIIAKTTWTYRSITNRVTDATVCEMNALRVAPMKHQLDISRTVITPRLAMIYATFAQRVATYISPTPITFGHDI